MSRNINSNLTPATSPAPHSSLTDISPGTVWNVTSGLRNLCKYWRNFAEYKKYFMIKVFKTTYFYVCYEN